MILSNVHTHTTFCDGKSTPREVIESAIAKGFHTIGFSGHSACKNGVFGMSEQNARDYFKEVSALKREYADRITVLAGIEMDAHGIRLDDYEYQIGSVHCLFLGDKYYPVDHSAEHYDKLMKSYGPVEKILADYFDEVVRMAKTLCPDIIGHFDLITKYNEGNKYFDEHSDLFLSLAENAIKRIKPYCNLFEMNTGAISRGIRSIPYPQPEILKLMRENDVDIIVNSDSHHKDTIDCEFDTCERLLKQSGYTKRIELTSNGKVQVEI